MKGLNLLAPKLISQVSKEVDCVAEAKIKQMIRSRGQEIEKIAPKIIKGTIEDVCKMNVNVNDAIRTNSNFFKKRF